MDQPSPDQSPGHAGIVASPGWYADPDDSQTLRWWDGHQWGELAENEPESASHRGAPGTDTNPASISNPDATRYAQILQPDPNEAVDDSDLSRSTRVGLIVAGVVVAIFLIAIAAVLLSRGSDDDPSEAITAASVVETLEAAGLPIGESQVYTESTDPDGLLGRPGLYVSRADFVDTTLDGDPGDVDSAVVGGGSVEVYGTTADALQRLEVVSSGSNENNIQVETVVVRLSPAISAADVAAYERTLEANYSDSGTDQS